MKERITLPACPHQREVFLRVSSTFSPRVVLRDDYRDGLREPRQDACFNVLRGAPEPHDADGDAPLYPVDQWVFKES